MFKLLFHVLLWPAVLMAHGCQTVQPTENLNMAKMVISNTHPLWGGENLYFYPGVIYLEKAAMNDDGLLTEWYRAESTSNSPLSLLLEVISEEAHRVPELTRDGVPGESVLTFLTLRDSAARHFDVRKFFETDLIRSNPMLLDNINRVVEIVIKEGFLVVDPEVKSKAEEIKRQLGGG